MGAGDSSLICSLVEVSAWADRLATTSEQFPINSRKTFLFCLANNGVGKAVKVDKFVLQLPVSLFTIEKKT
jgi:hypothetical protein